MTSLGRPIPFIGYENGQLVLNPEIEELLLTDSDCKIAVLTITGLYRTGKSFFMNRVLLNRANEGFSVGSTVNACTKGLQVWNELIPAENPEHKDLRILLVDSEGLGNISTKGSSNDTRIFMITLLLSSFFIYNSVGSIDEAALNGISIIINMAKEVQSKMQGFEGGDDNSNIEECFPSLLWIIRDFALRMEDQLGNAISPKDYLEKALELQKGISDAIENKNRIRRMVKHFFKERDCALFVRPVEKEEDIRNLNVIENEALRSEFIDQMKLTRQKIFRKIKPKTLQKKQLTTKTFLALTKIYIDCINRGAIPKIDDISVLLCKNTYRDITSSIFKEVEKEFEKNLGSNDEKQFSFKQFKKQIKERALKKFNLDMLWDDLEKERLAKKLLGEISRLFHSFKIKKIEKINTKYKEIASEITEVMIEQLKKGLYANFHSFEEDIEKFKKNMKVRLENMPKTKMYILQTVSDLYCLAGEVFSKSGKSEKDEEITFLKTKLSYVEDDSQIKTKSYNSNLEILKATIAEKDEQIFKLKQLGFSEEKEKYQILCHNFNDELQKKNEKEKKDYQFIQETNKKLLEYESQLTKLTQENYQLKMENLNLSSIAEKAEAKCQIGFDEDLRKELDDNRNLIQMLKYENLNLIQERNQLMEQLDSYKSEIDSSKVLNNMVLNAINEKKSSESSIMMNMQELSETNRNLSSALTNLQTQIQILEEKLNKSKPLKRMIKNCTNLQCFRCTKLFPAASFLVHIEQCSIRAKESLTPTGKSPLLNKGSFSVSLENVYQVNPEEKLTPRTIFFLLNVLNRAGRLNNTIKRNFNSVLNLFKILQDVYPRIDLPQSCLYVLEHPKELMTSRKFSLIQKSLNELGNHEIFKNSAPFLSYLELDSKSNNLKMSELLDNTPKNYEANTGFNEVKTQSTEESGNINDTSLAKGLKYDPFVRRHSSFSSKEMNNSKFVDTVEEDSPKKFLLFNQMNPDNGKVIKQSIMPGYESQRVSKRLFVDDPNKNKNDDSYALKSVQKKLIEEGTDLKFVDLGESNGLFAQPTFANYLDNKTPNGSNFNNYLSCRDPSLNNKPNSPCYTTALKLNRVHCENLKALSQNNSLMNMSSKPNNLASKNLYINLNAGDALPTTKTATPNKDMQLEYSKDKYDENSSVSPMVYKKKMQKMQSSKNSSLFICPRSPIKSSLMKQQQGSYCESIQNLIVSRR